MDDFASPNITSAYDVPPAKNNFISPGKRPMSSMSTTVVTDQQGRVVAVAGASGGTMCRRVDCRCPCPQSRA